MSLVLKPDPAPGYVAIPPFARRYTIAFVPAAYFAAFPLIVWPVDRAARLLGSPGLWSPWPVLQAFNRCGFVSLPIPNGAEYLYVVGLGPNEAGQAGVAQVTAIFDLQV